MTLDSYEGACALREYLLFHYGTPKEVLPLGFGPSEGLEFAKRTVSELVDTDTICEDARGLDLGCAVGRSTFELSRHCVEVLGLDKSAGFIRAAEALRKSGELAFDHLVQGEMFVPAVARVPSEIDRERVGFSEGDACALPKELEGFDVVHASNLLCRLPDPCALLVRFPDLVRSGGQLLLATPFTWLEEFTLREKWVGGRRGGRDSSQSLKAELSPFFRLEKEVDLPFLLREHERKYQYGISLGMRWRRFGD